MEGLSSSSLQSAATPASRPQQRFRRRRRRMENIPQQLGLVALLFGVLAVGSQRGHFMNDEGGARGGDAADGRALGGSDSFSGRQLQGHTVGNLTFAADQPVYMIADLPACAADVDVANSTYPPLPFGEDQKAAATVFQLVITSFMFLGLAIVCDAFFEASLSAICEAMSLKDDVAGATWMAAGGSAPELATSILGVFVSQSDVGIGTIVGSAVFNVLFVIACCAFVAPNLRLTWWPLARDASYYCFSLAMIVLFISDDLKIKHYEAIILLLMYVGYVGVMYVNESLEVMVTARVQRNEKNRSSFQLRIIAMFDHVGFAGLLYTIIIVNSVMVFVELFDEGRRSEDLHCWCGEYLGLTELPYSIYWKINLVFNCIFVIEMLVKFYAYGFLGYWKVPLNCFDGSLVFLIIVEFILENVAKSQGIAIGAFRVLRILKFVRIARILRMVRLVRLATNQTPTNQVSPDNYNKTRTGPQNSELGETNGKEYPKGDVEGGAEEADGDGAGDDEDDEDDEPFDPFDIPDGPIGKFFWAAGLPLSIAMWLTIPDCRREMFKKFWLATFTMCIVWIGALAFVMVWMITEFGKNYGLRDSIMGITLLAAGTSIPDCLSSIAVAKKGHGDMAVSSSIGSNIFDVLIGLPLPWFMYTAILNPAGAVDGPPDVPIISESLAVMILSLFVMVALVISTIHLSGWLLSIKLGAMMMGLYAAFLVLSLLLEFEVMFGPCDDTPLTATNIAQGFVIG